MDRAPYLMDGGRWGYRMGPAEIHDSMLRDGLVDAFSGQHSGWHTEDLASQGGPHPRSSGRLGAALAAALRRRPGRGPVRGRDHAGDHQGKKGDEIFARDEPPRPDTTLEVLAKLKPGLPPGRNHHRRQRAGPEQRAPRR